MSLFNNYKSDQSGNVSVMFAVGLITVSIAVGAAIDYGQMSKAQNNLQSQIDAGVLAASAVTMDDWNITKEQETAKRKEIAIEVMNSNGFDPAGTVSIDITADNTVLARAEMNYKTAFGGLLGKKSVNLVAESETGLGVVRDVHIALVMDNTLSMLKSGKMTALKTGAKNLINAVEASGSRNSKVALVPFARYVRIPPEEYTASWLELPDEFDTEITWQQATHTGGTCQLETRTRIRDGLEEEYQTNVCRDQITTYEEMSRTVESRFDGCVGTRHSPYSELDESYEQKVPGLLHLIPHQHSGTYESNAWCGQKITPLSDDFDLLESEVNKLYGTDQTYLPTGLLWGQTVLSQGEPFDNSDSSNSIVKIMVLMTDGQNSAQIQTGQVAEDAYRAPPYIGTSQNADEYSPEANLATARMCDKIKAEGINIYTIAFQVDDIVTKNLLTACATDLSKAYIAETNDGLIEIFDHISGSLKGNARLMR